MATTPIKAIREFCLECVGEYKNDVKTCPSVNCPLYAFRLGKNPYKHSRELTAEQREAIAVRLAVARKKKDENNEQNY